MIVNSLEKESPGAALETSKSLLPEKLREKRLVAAFALKLNTNRKNVTPTIAYPG